MKKQDKSTLFFNKAVKQGNSLCIRIPSKIVHKLDLNSGTNLAIGLSNIDKGTKLIPSGLIKPYRKIIALKKLSDKQIIDFLKYYSIEITSGEKMKLGKDYEGFRKSMSKRKNRKIISEGMKKTKSWKKLILSPNKYS